MRIGNQLFMPNAHQAVLDKIFIQFECAEGGKLDHNLTGVKLIFIINCKLMN